MKLTRTTMLAATILVLLSSTTLLLAKDALRLRTALSGSTFNQVTPSGHAEYRADDKGRRRLNVEVEHVNLPDGTKLTVEAIQGGVTLALPTSTLELHLQAGELEIENGAPDLSKASTTIQVRSGATIILTGVLNP